ncbi:hypothetical protein Mgra_00006683 [Meloidogyne graminicola]|uniref:Uncharacterized protein n=1 Tax=Meloidogyne graminicola TaxID=189291 RepID=A0A8S9ZKH0_9BILA|nr:hypothetical protein Mgra_00006683 [Meloidogyne graminicola]
MSDPNKKSSGSRARTRAYATQNQTLYHLATQHFFNYFRETANCSEIFSELNKFNSNPNCLQMLTIKSFKVN